MVVHFTSEKYKSIFCVLQSSQNDKNCCFDDNSQKAKNILLKPLLLKVIYSERQSLEPRPSSPSGGGGWGLGGILYRVNFPQPRTSQGVDHIQSVSAISPTDLRH